MKNFIKKILNIHISISFFIIIGTIIFYCAKYYKQGELVFLQNQFGFFIGFSLLVILVFHILIFLNIDLKKEIKLANKTINNILKLTNMLLEEHYLHNDSNVELHRNTRDCILRLCKKKLKKDGQIND